MKIAIDIDGVILNTEKWFKVQAELENIKLKKEKYKDKTAFRIEDKYDWSDNEIRNFWENNINKGTKEAEFMTGAIEIINMLKKEGHTVVINTARGIDDGLTSNEEKEILINSAKDKLDKADLKFDEYFWAVSDKSIVCKEEKVDIMIEDNYLNCLKVAREKINVLYLRDAGSKKIENNQYVQEVNNWGEIYRFIKDFSEKNK